MMVAQLQAADIGSITELKGAGQVVRDDVFQAELKFGIESYDNVKTANGRVGITFLDDSKVRLTEHSQLIIDEFIFDPNPSKSKMALQFASGTARFITGKLASIDKENISIKTPSATIGIRGTDFTVTVDELGRSLVILLPDEFGNSSGEIIVSTAIGQAVLNQPYQATSVSVFESKPSKPVILDITLELIDNMLIVQPPKERLVETENTSQSTSSILDTDFLEFDELEQDYLAEDNLEFSELDINYLDVNFLEDLLNIIEEVDQLESEQLGQVSETNIKGTEFGFDSETQINTFINDGTLTVLRSVQDTVRLEIDSSGAYTVLLVQDGKSTQILINGGNASTIKIKQSS
jgi:hypothetical protein